MARRRDAPSPLHPFPTAPSLLRYFVPSYLRTFVRQNTPATNRQFSPSPPCTPTPSALRRGQQTNLPLLRWFDARFMGCSKRLPCRLPHPAKSLNFEGVVPT